MTTTTMQQRSELDHRSTDGLDVSLVWNTPAERVTIELSYGRLDRRLEFEVAPDKALDAFRHPYLYAPADALNALSERGEAVHS